MLHSRALLDGINMLISKETVFSSTPLLPTPQQLAPNGYIHNKLISIV